jgi:Mannosylglycerate hydrolase MGH1-like glycoside hydrolase domain/Glycosyl hydrolase family 63 C-terminal domain
MSDKKITAEEKRLQASETRKEHWKRWGPYISERAWGTVREDYSPFGTAWEYFPHDHARSRAYRWNEDGIAGICDRHQYFCFALSLWNGLDPILKERMFGLSGNEGNHGEDVKEYYYYLDSTPTHSYMEFLYKYPQKAFPYAQLVAENRKRRRTDLEFELMDTGVFDENRYFDVFVNYAKADSETILIRINAMNQGPEEAELHLLPTIWFRNTWQTGLDERRPHLRKVAAVTNAQTIRLNQDVYGERWLYCEGSPELLFTENETNSQKLFGTENQAACVKDGINNFVVKGIKDAVNPKQKGTKASAWYKLRIGAGSSSEIRLVFTNKELQNPFEDFETTFQSRKKEADEFYETIIPNNLSADTKNVLRQSLGGMLWSKQFYNYEVSRWLKGDPSQPPPPPERKKGRNSQWTHLYNADVISMPDKWEYPWYAAWDLAFHCIALSIVDSEFAKEQLILLLREWYMHPNGQLPAYEWALGDVNPPVHAWAAWRVYKIEKKRKGVGDKKFLERVFHKLLLNFTWWINRKDTEGRNVFQGGFLGLDNIGVFDRSAPLPTGGYIEQSDATSWMGMYCLNMLSMALELARQDPAYEDVASKFFEHFVYICNAMNNIASEGIELWNNEDGFFYDVLHLPDGRRFPMKIRSMVGLIPLFAVTTLDSDEIDHLTGFKRRMQWFIENRPDLGEYIETQTADDGFRRFLSLVNRNRLTRVLSYMLDENEFLSQYGIRGISRFHKDHPYSVHVNGNEYRVDYEPAESSTGLFGGNSNWRGPIWFPLNYLIIESLQKFHFYLGDSFKVEFPTGSGQHHDLWEIAGELSRRLTHIFLHDENGKRPVFGGAKKFQEDPNWQNYILFYEYFHGDLGCGLGASHQTGWTGLVAKLLQQSGE